jgi:hypothetical protein
MTDFVTNEVTPDLSLGAVEAQAERELGALMAGGDVTPTSETPVVPEPTQEAPPPVVEQTEQTAAPLVAEPSVSLPAPATPGALENPEFKKALEIYGGDPAVAAKGFLETNTRNAQFAAKLRELGWDPKTLTLYETRQSAPVEQTQAPVDLDPKVVEGEVTRLLDSDPVFVNYVQEHLQNKAQLSEIAGAKATATTELQEAQLALRLPMIQADSFQADLFRDKAYKAELKLEQLAAKEDRITLKQERLREKADLRADVARQQVTGAYQKHQTEQFERAELQRLQSQSYAEISTSWPVALERAIKDFKIPADLVDDFRQNAKVAGLAHLQQTEEPINDIFGFVANVAKAEMAKLDRYHRAMSQTYAKQVTQRADVIAGAPTAPAPPAPRTGRRRRSAR